MQSLTYSPLPNPNLEICVLKCACLEQDVSGECVGKREKSGLKKGPKSIDPTRYMEWHREKTERMSCLFLRQEG